MGSRTHHKENPHEHRQHLEEPVITSYAKAPARTINAGGVTYAYRELGPKGGIPVVFFVHLAATLDNWDPRIVDPIAKDRHVIAFDNRGVGASTGEVPDAVRRWPLSDTFIRALGFDKVDVFSFSLGGMVAQALVVKHPEVRPQARPHRHRPRSAARTSTRSPGSPTTTSSALP